MPPFATPRLPYRSWVATTKFRATLEDMEATET
jgi:hypothetical protein